MKPLPPILPDRIRKPVRRLNAEGYLLITLLSFAASVTLTRMFLELTGYPKLGGSSLHIAHVLWGGLLLFVAALLPLIYANRWAFSVSAFLAGAGAGLFIDEVGKFITQNNNYFYAPAAPIIYAFFLITVLVYIRVRRFKPPDARSSLYSALESLQEVLDQDLEVYERSELVEQLEQIVEQNQDPAYTHLAKELLHFLKGRKLQPRPDRATLVERWVERLETWEARHIHRAHLRRILILGLGIVGLLDAGGLIYLLVSSLGPDSLGQTLIEMATASSITSAAQAHWYVLRVLLEGLAGLLVIAGCAQMILRRRERLALGLAYYGLLVSLTTVDILVFYFDQFSSIVLATVQFSVLLILLRYRWRFIIQAASRSPQDGELP